MVIVVDLINALNWLWLGLGEW